MTSYAGGSGMEATQEVVLEEKEVETARIPFKFYLQGAVRLASPLPAIILETQSSPVRGAWSSAGEEEGLDEDWWTNPLGPPPPGPLNSGHFHSPKRVPWPQIPSEGPPVAIFPELQFQRVLK